MSTWKPFVMGIMGVIVGIVLLVGIAYAADIFTVDRDGTVRLVVTDSGNVGIGTGNPSYLLDMVATANEAIRLRNTTSDATTKIGRMMIGHYTNSEEDVYAFGSASVSNAGYVAIGGGHPSFNAATQIDLYTAATNTTLQGTSRMTIASTGNVGIGTGSPATSAKLDIASTTGAILIPRMTTAQRDALTAVNGMMIYNASTNAFNFYENGAWGTK